MFHVLATHQMHSSCTSGYILQSIRWQVGFKHIAGNSSKTETETHFLADRVLEVLLEEVLTEISIPIHPIPIHLH